MENNGGGHGRFFVNQCVRDFLQQPPTGYSPPESSSTKFHRLRQPSTAYSPPESSSSTFPRLRQPPTEYSPPECSSLKFHLLRQPPTEYSPPKSSSSKFHLYRQPPTQYSPPESSSSKFHRFEPAGPSNTALNRGSVGRLNDGGSSRLPRLRRRPPPFRRRLEEEFQRSCSLQSNGNGFDRPINQNHYPSNGNGFDRPINQNHYPSNANGFTPNPYYLEPLQWPNTQNYHQLAESDCPSWYDLDIAPSRPSNNSAPLSMISAPPRWNNPNGDSFGSVVNLYTSSRHIVDSDGGDPLELSDDNDNFMKLAMDSNGSRVLQKEFGLSLMEYEIDFYVNQVVNNIAILATNPFGNHVVIKLMEQLNRAQRLRIISALASNHYQFFCICVDTHGTRVVQRLVEMIDPHSSAEVQLIVEALAPFTLWLTKSATGHHVVQHCLKHFPAVRNEKFLNEVADHCMEMATDKSGCCVLQLCVEYATDQIQVNLLREIIDNSVYLSQDRYGNYVVQHILLLKIPVVTAQVLHVLEGNYLSLSQSKYGSNVVERCLKESNQEQVGMIITELLSNPELGTLFVDSYGNYVIKTALEVSQGIARTALITALESRVPDMRSNMYGKKLLAYLERRNRHHNNGP